MIFKKQVKRGNYALLLIFEGTKDIRITSISNGNAGNTEVLTAASTEITAATLVVVDSGLGEHGVILNLRLSKRRAVVGNENKLS